MASLLDGMYDAVSEDPIMEAINDALLEDLMEKDLAMETAMDGEISLSDSDIAAILNDNDPDNQFADFDSDEDDSDLEDLDGEECGTGCESYL